MEKYKNLFDTMDLGVVYRDNKGKIIEANKAAEKILGMTKGQMSALDSISKEWNFIDEDGTIVPGNMHPAILALASGKKVKNTVMGIYNPKLNQQRWININSVPEFIKDSKKPYRVYSTFQDITARKKFEEQLKLTLFGINHSQISIFQVDDNGNIYYTNDQACISLGYTCEEFSKLKIWDIDINLDPEKWLKHRKNTKNHVNTTIETNHRRKDGTEFPVEVTINFVEYQKKKISFSFAKDITNRKMAEKALQNQMKEYQSLSEDYMLQNKELIGSLERINKINNELEDAKMKAEESDRLKTSFLANMSHEIRTPMNGIMGFSELLRNPDISSHDTQRFVDVIQQSGERMLNIINDLIDISKIEAGQMELRPEKTNVNHLLDDLYTFFKPDTSSKKLEFILNTKSSAKGTIISTDKTKLTQILSNLIKNAIKYTNEGKISYGYSIKDSILEFYVKDTGIGIEHELQDKVFERFRQADLSATRPYDGTGLGLSISKSFVEMLGGKIWLESAPETGSTFYFSLPFNKAKIKSGNTVSEEFSEAANMQKITILIAEDDETSLFLLKELFKKSGLRSLHAKNGKQAIEIIKKNPGIDLVLMDIKMPGLNGFDATRKIKQIKPQLPIIAQTAFASHLDKQKSMEAGCDDYISKPINKDDLMEMIRKHIQNTQS